MKTVLLHDSVITDFSEVIIECNNTTVKTISRN